ncbi:hypothetical protein ABIE49_005915 [Bradyrhizobium sp. OAE829]
MPSGIAESAVREIAASLAVLLAEVFALYLKTENFHWHVSGPHFRSIHLLLDKQASDLLAITDPIAERARAIGGNRLRSIGHIARLQRLVDNELPNSVQITGRWRSGCGQPTNSVKKGETSPLQACWKTGLTRLNEGLGSCSSPRDDVGMSFWSAVRLAPPVGQGPAISGIMGSSRRRRSPYISCRIRPPARATCRRTPSMSLCPLISNPS